MSNGGAVSAPHEKINVDIVTLTRFLTEEQTKHKEATGDFTYAFCHLRCCDKQTDEPCW
jgi:fructose-1,6-bisphosphatase I